MLAHARRVQQRHGWPSADDCHGMIDSGPGEPEKLPGWMKARFRKVWVQLTAEEKQLLAKYRAHWIDTPGDEESGEAFTNAEKNKNKKEQKQRTAITATPFVWRDPASIPPRRFLYARHYVRKYLTCTIATSGVGKTSLAIVEALAMATGRPLLGITPTERARVWIWNGEDPEDELIRRIIGAMLHYNIKPEDVESYLFCNSGRSMPIVMATQVRMGNVTVAVPVRDEVIHAIGKNKIDVLTIDPFVKSHRIPENDNIGMDVVATQWAEIADQTECAIELLHHTRKTGGHEVTIEDTRGASSLVSASRSVRVLNKMTSKEAGDAQINAGTAWRYFRLDNGRASMAPPPEKSIWYRLTSIALANSDDVGVAAKWTYPDPFDDIRPDDLRRAQAEVDKGGPWREHYQAKEWVGIPIARALKLNAKKKEDRKKIMKLLEVWIESGMFIVVEGEGRSRHKTNFVEVGERA
jgi:hypothetical protein